MFHRDRPSIRFIKKHPLLTAIALIFLIFLAGRVLAALRPEAVPERAEQIKSVELMRVSDINQELSAVQTTGEVEALQQVELKSEVFAKITRVHVTLGQRVSAGQLLMNFDAGNLAAQRDQAAAEVDRAIAAKAQLQAQVSVAEASLDRTKSATENAVAAAKSALALAQNNLLLNHDTLNSRIVQDAFDNARGTFVSAQSAMTTVLMTADSIVGIDNEGINDSYEAKLAGYDLNTLSRAKRTYRQIRAQKRSFDVTFTNGIAPDQNIEDALGQTADLLLEYQRLMSDVSDVLANTAPSPEGAMSQAVYDGLVGNIQGARGIVTGQYSAVIAQQQAIANAKNAADNTEVTYNQAVRNLQAVEAQAKAEVATAEAQLAQARAAIASQDALIAGARAQVRSINASLGKTSIRTPISGTIGVLPVRVGELVNSGSVVASVVNTKGLQIRAYLGADEINGISVNGSVRVDNRFDAVVSHVAPSIDPATRKVEVIVIVTETDAPIVVGDFVDVSIEPTVDLSPQESIYIPLAAVQIGADRKAVFIVNESGVVEARSVEVARISGDKVEITSGLEDIEFIVASVRGIEEGQTVNIL